MTKIGSLAVVNMLTIFQQLCNCIFVDTRYVIIDLLNTFEAIIEQWHI